MTTSIPLPARRGDDRGAPLLELVGDITGRQATTLKGSLRGYYQALPSLLGESFLGALLPATAFRKQVKSCALSERVYLRLFEAINAWRAWDEPLADALLRRVVPTLMGIASMHRRDNDAYPVSLALGQIAEQAGNGKVRLVSLVCPSYRYRRDANGKLWHCSGELLPTAGPRFGSVAATLARVFAPLAELDVSLDWQFWCYTGETGDVEHLVDMARFVRQYYQGDLDQLFATLGLVAEDLNRQLREQMGACGINARTCSLDRKYGARIHAIRDSFASTFPDQLDDIYRMDEVEAWLDGVCGCGRLIHFFIEQEMVYRRNVLMGFTEPVVSAALREMLLYTHILAEVRNEGLVVIDTESTSNYMTATLNCIPAGLIFTRSARGGGDEAEGGYTLDIRQPYNVVNS